MQAPPGSTQRLHLVDHAMTTWDLMPHSITTARHDDLDLEPHSITTAPRGPHYGHTPFHVQGVTGASSVQSSARGSQVDTRPSTRKRVTGPGGWGVWGYGFSGSLGGEAVTIIGVSVGLAVTGFGGKTVTVSVFEGLRG